MGSGVSTSKPLGNNGSGVSWQTPFGGSAATLPQIWTNEQNNWTRAFHGSNGMEPFQRLDPSRYLNRQHNDALAQANQAGLIGQQAGNALGGGGLGTHYSNLGYNNALAQFAQIAAGQNAQGQNQAMQGIGALMALLPLLL